MFAIKKMQFYPVLSISLEEFLSDISDRTLKYLLQPAIDGAQPDLLKEIASYLVQAELSKLQLYFTYYI